jgi:type II restriction enzyme
MTTEKQLLGAFGERRVVKNCSCPKCKRRRTLRRLPPNFKCADVICDFCGYLAQVKAHTTKTIERLASRLPGGAWQVQRDRMNAGIYFPLFVVQVNARGKYAIYYLPADFQTNQMFISRKPLSSRARRKGWRGFSYDLTRLREGSVVRIA